MWCRCSGTGNAARKAGLIMAGKVLVDGTRVEKSGTRHL